MAGAQAQLQRAVRLYGAAERVREEVGLGISPSQRADYDQNVDGARAGLGDQAFAAGWAEGRAMTMAQAIEYALR